MSVNTRPIALLFDDPEQAINRRERVLLVLAGLFTLTAHLTLIAARHLEGGTLWLWGVWVLAAVGGHLSLSRALPRRDPYFFPVVMFLVGWGLAIIHRVAPEFAGRQAFWLIISLIALIGVSRSPDHLRWLSRYRYVWLFSGLILLALTIILGRNPAGDYGPRLWLGVDGIFFQPAEVLKLLLIVFISSYFAQYRQMFAEPVFGPNGRITDLLRYVAPLALMWGLSMVILVWQRDLGTAMLFFMVFLAMLYLASGRLLILIGGIGLILGAGVLAYIGVDLVRARIDVWLNPWLDPRNRSFQVIQSLMAFASGGIWGQGIGQGSPTYIPVVHSDFIFAAVGEEWGLLGALCVVILLAFLTLRGLRLAILLQARPFRSYLAAGVGITLGAQSLLIMGGALRLIPLTGVTLPFLSYGGSSLLISFLMIGMLLILSEEV